MSKQRALDQVSIRQWGRVIRLPCIARIGQYFAVIRMPDPFEMYQRGYALVHVPTGDVVVEDVMPEVACRAAFRLLELDVPWYLSDDVRLRCELARRKLLLAALKIVEEAES